MKVMGIDQSYRSTGVVILEDDEILLCKKVSTDPKEDVYTRANNIATVLVMLAQEHAPERVAFEGLSFGSTGNVTRDLGGLLFTLILNFRNNQFDPQVIPPPTVKKVATGKGNAKKEAVIEALPDKVRAEFDALGVKKTTGLADLADAYWIARAVAKM